MLRERDELREDEKDWVLKEAMNPKNLQHGGTFWNTLFRKVDDVVIPIFSEIISIIDQNYNLYLIDPSEQNSPLSSLWLQMFQDCRIMQFQYVDMVTPKGLGLKMRAGNEFVCKFPFSWLVYEAVENQWNNAKSSTGTGYCAHQNCIFIITVRVT